MNIYGQFVYTKIVFLQSKCTLILLLIQIYNYDKMDSIIAGYFNNSKL